MSTKSAWLQEVEDDATRIAEKRFKDFFEEQQYQKEKLEKLKAKKAPKEAVLPAGGETYEPSEEKGKK
jgi:hypothetical protein